MNAEITEEMLNFLDLEGGVDAQHIFDFMIGVEFPVEYGAHWELNPPYLEGWQMTPWLTGRVMRMKINVRTAELTTCNPYSASYE